MDWLAKEDPFIMARDPVDVHTKEKTFLKRPKKGFRKVYRWLKQWSNMRCNKREIVWYNHIKAFPVQGERGEKD